MGVYIYLFLCRPDDARHSLSSGLNTFGGLLTLILAAVLLASAIQTLIPAGVIQQCLGAEAGLKGVLTGGLLGGLMQGGPYGVSPIIRGLQEEGMSLAAVLAMLIGYGAVGSGRIAWYHVFRIEDNRHQGRPRRPADRARRPDTLRRLPAMT